MGFAHKLRSRRRGRSREKKFLPGCREFASVVCSPPPLSHFQVRAVCSDLNVRTEGERDFVLAASDFITVGFLRAATAFCD